MNHEMEEAAHDELRNGDAPLPTGNSVEAEGAMLVPVAFWGASTKEIRAVAEREGWSIVLAPFRAGFGIEENELGTVLVAVDEHYHVSRQAGHRNSLPR